MVSPTRGVGEELVRDAADGPGRHVALALRPFRGVPPHVVEEDLEGGTRLGRLVVPLLAVRPFLDAGRDPHPVEGRATPLDRVERDRPLRVEVEEQGSAALRVAEEVAVRTDEVGGVGGFLQERDVAHLAPRALVHDAVEERVEEGRIGLRPDGDPLRRHRPGDGEVRLDLDALEPARARIRLAPDPGHPRRCLRVVAATDDVAGAGGVGGDDERPVPELAVEVLAVVALDPLPGPETHVDGPPRGEEGGEGPHVLGGGAAAPEAHREPREPRLVHEPPGADLEHLRRNRAQGLVPAHRDEPGVLATALARVGAPHGLTDAVGVVGLLDEAVGLDAHPPAPRVAVARVEVGADPGRDPVLDLDLHQIRTGDALVAVDRLPVLGRALGGAVPGSVSAHFSLLRRKVPQPLPPARSRSARRSRRRRCRSTLDHESPVPGPPDGLAELVAHFDLEIDSGSLYRSHPHRDVHPRVEKSRPEVLELDPDPDRVLALVEVREDHLPAGLLDVAQHRRGGVDAERLPHEVDGALPVDVVALHALEPRRKRVLHSLSSPLSVLFSRWKRPSPT